MQNNLDDKSEYFEITRYIHEQIPITASVGAVIEYYDGSKLTVFSPLEPNLNHKKTAFGGSLSTLGILACWALLHLKLKDSGLATELVIQNSSFDYISPVKNDFYATALLPSTDEFKRFIKCLKRRGKARIEVYSEINDFTGIHGKHR